MDRRHSMISDIVARSAEHPQMVEAVTVAVTAAVRANLGAVIHSVLREHYPGETIALYVRKSEPPSHANEAIRQDLERGLSIAQVARLHGKSERQVYRIAAKRRLQRRP